MDPYFVLLATIRLHLDIIRRVYVSSRHAAQPLRGVPRRLSRKQYIQVVLRRDERLWWFQIDTLEQAHSKIWYSVQATDCESEYDVWVSDSQLCFAKRS